MSRVMEIMRALFHENDFAFKELSDNQIAVRFESDYTYFNTVFQIDDDDDSYEHYTEICRVPYEKRGKVAEEVIKEAWRGVTPVLPGNSDKLLLYGSKSDLQFDNDEDIRDYILDDIGRISSFDNEMRPILNYILSNT